MKRHTDNLAVRQDVNMLDWANADAEFELEWNKIMANSLFPVEGPAPKAPSKRVSPTPRGMQPPPATQGGDPVDEILRDMGL
jgi:hypothetical protein